MARRKGVSKTRNLGARKLISENSSLPKEENRLKNDQSNPRDMEESKLISKKLHIKGNEYQKDSKISADRPSHRKESSDRRADDDELVHRTPSDSTISTDLISSNNNNSKTLNSSSNDLKYLHKKFKRIASATLDEVQRQPPEVVKNLQTTLTNSQENSVKSAKGPGPHAAFNGHVDYVNIKREFLASELNGEGTEGVGLSNNFKVKFSPCNDDSSHSNFSIKVERTSSPVTSQNNNVLGRLPLIVSNFSGSTVSTVSVTNVGSSLRVHQPQVSSQRPQQREVVDQSFSGRHVCPYCNLNCTKPSVLQKHIRAHTNERPYPCDTCGFAFKTKSNYYKHCRSRSHALRTKGGEAPPDDDASLGSDQDQDPDLSNSSSDVISRTTSPMDERTSSPAVQQQAAQSIQKYSNEKPYKPKFHNAALYAKEEISHIQRQQQQQQQQQQQHHHQQQQQQHQQQHQQHNNLNHQSHSTDYYPAALQPHQGHDSLTQQQQQTQGQLSRSRGDQAPGLPTNTQGFQHVPPPSGYVESTPLSSRESTSASFSGIVVAGGGHQLNREFLQEHISKIISQNEAIVENKELLLQKKYPKLSGKSKNSTIILSNESSNTKLAFALANKQQQQHLQQQGRDEVTMCKSTAISNSLANNTAVLLASRVNQQSISQASQSQEAPVAFQPLNLSKIAEQIDISRKRHPVESPSVVSEGNSPATSGIKSGPSRVVNQERSIIKHLLLNARGLGVPNGEGEDAVYICPLCKMEFRSAEDLKLHTSNYCQGGPSSAPISPVASPSYKYFRSNSINVSLPEFNNPNSLAKLARSSLLHLSKNPLSLAKLAWSQLKTKPSNLVLSKLSVNTNTTAAGSSNASDSTCSTHSKNIDAPLPSPGPLLGKTPLVESYNNSERKSEDVVITKVHEENRNFVKFSSKRLRLNHYPQQAFQGMLGDANAASGSNNISSYNNANLPFEVSPMKYAMCGGDVQMLDKKEDRMKRYLSSGGCVIPISECPDIEVSPKMIRTPLLSGGSFTEVSPKSSIKDTPPTPSSTPKMMIPIAPLTPSLPAPNLLSAGLPLATHFQFPPINSITAFNPLTLPPVSIVPSTVMHGDKLIPFVPGIPGPNSLAPPTLVHPPQIASDISLNRNLSPSRKKEANILNSMNVQPDGVLHMTHSPSPRLVKPIIRIEGELPSPVGDSSRLLQGSPRHSQPGTGVESIKKSFNFTRMADNISPRKGIIEKTTKSPEKEREIRHFNFENIPKVDIIAISQPSQLQSMAPLHVDVSSIITSQTIQKQPSECELSEVKNKAKSKFLRPTSLPLKPGTFTPKRHHGITPTANTLPLISPETPRPSKACIQLYLNGHAYTYLGLKCSTKMFYCTVNCPQPSYVANLHKLSMYSVWQVCAENNPHPLGLKPKEVMSLYDTCQRSSAYTTTAISAPCTVVHSQPPVMTPFESSAATSGQFYHHQVKSIQPPVDPGLKSDGSSKSSGNVLVGGYESHEDYTYIRGRGRGRYVCLECGIRCKKPSMLKKHIRTHTDVRPYTCQHCSFSFKTKGNLTKHMQSKTHYKKCLELGINPGPMPAEGEFMDTDGDTDQQSVISAGGRTSSIPGESDSDDYSDIGDNETESSDTDESKSRLPEHEAARCLLSLSMTPPANSVSQHMHQSRPQYGFKQMEPMQVSSVNAGRSSEEVQHAAGQPYSSRRVISFTSPKPPFDYQKQEQYYSNPSIIPKGRDEKFDESSMKPIDLTKPRQVDKPKIFEVIGDLTNESGLLKSLVSITDKIRSSTEPAIQVQKMDESVLLQAYLTEQALQYTKIKQSQMNKHFPEVMSCSSTSTVTLTVSPSRGSVYERVPDTVLSGTPYSSRTPELSSVVFSTITTPCTSIIRSSSVVDDQLDRSIDKDCEKGNSTEVIIPAPLDHRLESSRSPSLIQSDSKIESEHRSPAHYNSSAICPVVSVQEPSKDVTQSPRPRSLPPGTGGAKSVASEYLKMTSAELLKSRSSRTEESEESSSDQEINVTETGSSIKPPADFAGVLARTVIVGEDGFKNSSNEVQPMFPRVPLSDDGRPVCTICSKTFQKQHQMVLHMNIHYMERKFKCEPCAVSFRTQGHLQKHERSEAHKNKVMMTSTFGVPTTSNPRPFECSDCKVAFRIHGHLAKHLRSKTHVQKLECLQKLPFGTYAEIERAGISLTEIDTTDCDNSLASLKALAQKLIDKDPTKLNSYSTSPCMETNSATGSHESGSEDSPDRQAELNEMRDLPDVPLMAVSVPPAEGSGLKRKFDSVNNCSNDSFAVGPQETLEKRLRTTSET